MKATTYYFGKHTDEAGVVVYTAYVQGYQLINNAGDTKAAAFKRLQHQLRNYGIKRWKRI